MENKRFVNCSTVPLTVCADAQNENHSRDVCIRHATRIQLTPEAERLRSISPATKTVLSLVAGGMEV